MLYIETAIRERNRTLKIEDEQESEEEQEIIEPTEEELDNYYRDKAEKYWEKKW